MSNPFVDLLEKFRRGRRSVFSLGPFLPIEIMRQREWPFKRVLQESASMARAALAKLDLGFESTVLPFDLNVEAEALGAAVCYHEDQEGIPVYPTLSAKIAGHAGDLVLPPDMGKAGRIPRILSAIALARAGAAGRGAVGAFVAGPFTLAGQMMDMDNLFVMTIKRPALVDEVLAKLTQAVIGVRNAYCRAGAQFVVVLEGGAAAISPALFARLLLPRLKEIFRNKPVPHVLSVAGHASRLIGKILQCGADGLCMDQSCDVDQARAQTPMDFPLAAVIGDHALLATAEPNRVRETVRRFLDKKLTLVLPPADIYPPAKLENIAAFVDEARSYVRFSSTGADDV